MRAPLHRRTGVYYKVSNGILFFNPLCSLSRCRSERASRRPVPGSLPRRPRDGPAPYLRPTSMRDEPSISSDARRREPKISRVVSMSRTSS